MPSEPPCYYLDWDSEFFGCRIARISVNRLKAEDMERIIAWRTSHAIDCLYLLADALDPVTIALAEDHDFRLVDIRLTFEHRIHTMVDLMEDSSAISIRLSRAKDIPFLKSLAKQSYHLSRFYYDLNFPKFRCDALYETWIEKSCNGYADAVLVAEERSRPVGYVSCHLLSSDTGNIGLVGITQDMQAKGIGKRLINASLQWFSEEGIRRVTVVTQGRNVTAQRLYQKCGFLSSSVYLWYHRWFPFGIGENTPDEQVLYPL